jgi:hypothetical protein
MSYGLGSLPNRRSIYSPLDERYRIILQKTLEESGSPMQFKDSLRAMKAEISIGCTATIR